jgi:hypothetical protein
MTRTLANASAADRNPVDFYATPDDVTDALIESGLITGTKLSGAFSLSGTIIWEPACGQGHMARRLEHHGATVAPTTLHDMGYGITGVDFLQAKKQDGVDWIKTNPPF